MKIRRTKTGYRRVSWLEEHGWDFVLGIMIALVIVIAVINH